MHAAIDTAGLHAAARINITEEIARTMGQMSLALNIKDAARREDRIAQLEMYLDDLDAQMAALDELAEVQAANDIEVAEEVEQAMDAAAKTGTALVRSAARIGRKLEVLVPGCMTEMGATRFWEVWTERADGTREGWRLTLTGSASVGVMRRMALDSNG